MYWKSLEDKHLVLEFGDVRDGACGKSVHDTVMADFKKEVRDPINFANLVVFEGKVMKDRLGEVIKNSFNKDKVLHLKDLRFESQDVLLRNLKITDFKISQDEINNASSIVLQFVLKDTDHKIS